MKFNLGWFAIHAVDHCNQKCSFCNNHAPFLERREYWPEDYFPHIDTMLEKEIDFDEIRVSGGEPFLHEDITKFVCDLKERYGKKMAIATNLFWLQSEKDIEKHQELFKRIETFYPSYYPHNSDKIKLLQEIQQNFDLKVQMRLKHWFSKLEFTNRPQKVTKFCTDNGDCTNLLVDGRLARCAVGAYCENNPNVTEEFLNHRQDMFFDLYEDSDIESWRNKWPHDACQYCTLWRAEAVKWKNNEN